MKTLEEILGDYCEYASNETLAVNDELIKQLRQWAIDYARSQLERAANLWPDMNLEEPP